MKIRNLSKSFGDNLIFNNASFDFEDGKTTYVMGKSGIGKTTLLRIIAGLDKSFAGEIESSKKVAYVFQEARLFPTLTLKENIEIVNDTPKIHIDTILKILELEEASQMFPDELSGGMKIRASLGRAIYFDADVVLMDEPFASIDEDMKDRISSKVFELLKDKTVIIVSHDTQNANKFADKIITIK